MKKKYDKGYPYRDRKILLIDLTNDEYSYSSLSQNTFKDFHGGRALSYKLWDDYADLNTINQKCLYIGAPIIISIGSGSDLGLDYLNNATVLTYSLSTKKIISTTFNSPMLVQSLSALNLSAIVITGRSRRLSKIEIKENSVNIDLCEMFHNLKVKDVIDNFPSASSIISIGETGEKRLDYASINIDKKNIGLSGIGASFGEKNIKLVAFFTNNTSFREPYYDKLSQETDIYFKKYSDINYLEYANKFGWAAIEGFKYRYDPRMWGLYNNLNLFCNVDWINALALGANIGIYNCKNVEIILKACNEYSIDSISFSIYLIWILEAEKEKIINLKLNDDLKYIDKILNIIESLAQGKSTFVSISERVNKISKKYGFEKKNFTSLDRELYPFDLRALNSYAISLITNDDTIVPWEMFSKIKKKDLAKTLFYSQIYREICESLGLSWNQVLYLVYKDCKYNDDNNKFVRALTKLFSISEGYRIDEKQLIDFGKKSLFYRKQIEKKVFKKVEYSIKNVPLYFSTNSYSNFKEKKVLNIAKEIEDYIFLYEMEKSKLKL